jgi:HK97 family phage prohead protease
MKYDFGGYATKNDLKCSDGRTIRKNAFKDNDGQIVPLVWQHVHDNPNNVLGHALLENREDGVYVYGKFNDTEFGKQAKSLVSHKDITNLSIYANNLEEKAKNVLHGAIREVSLVLAGANPGAKIVNLAIEHSDGSEEEISEEAVITTDEMLSLTDIEHEDKPAGGKTMQEIFDTLNADQKNVVYAMLSHALGDDGEGLDDEPDDSGTDDKSKIKHSDEGGKIVKKNIFDNQDREDTNASTKTLTHAQFGIILEEAQKTGSFKKAVLAHATEYGIENIDVLFPDAQALSKDPEWLKREDGWVAGVLAAIHHSPFSRVKSTFADMDFATARAKGYVKGTEKKEVYFKASKRVTTPTTVYVKQKLDRDDIIDVVDFDIIGMVRFELRTLLDEELAKAALIGDGRDVSDPDKINEENVRPIWKDEDLYAVKELLSTKTDYKAMVKEIALTNKDYKGSGSPVFYTTPDVHTNMLWIEDLQGRRIYESDATLCSALRVSAIIEIPDMEGLQRTLADTSVNDLIGIKVNLRDYNFGADKGGQVASFDDFDIDFNQYKYLLETRVSGALTKAKSAQVYEVKHV